VFTYEWDKPLKKRLRKKKHVGEFQEFGFSVQLRFSEHLSVDDRDSLLDDFIGAAIEANGLLCGGGGNGHSWEVFVTLDRRGSATEIHRQKVGRWLSKENSILQYEVGPLEDAWYSDGLL